MATFIVQATTGGVATPMTLTTAEVRAAIHGGGFDVLVCDECNEDHLNCPYLVDALKGA